MPLFLSTTIAAVAYAGFAMGLAVFLQGGRASLSPREGVASAFALMALLFLPAGALPPILPYPVGLIAVPTLLLAHTAALHSDGRERVGVVRYGVLPMGLMAFVFGWTAFSRGMPGGIADAATFVTLPLWSIMDGGGCAGLVLVGTGFALLAGRGFAAAGAPGLLARFVSAQFLLALVAPLTISRLFGADLPPWGLILDFTLNWALVCILATGVFPVLAHLAGDGKGRFSGWISLVCGLALIAADTLEFFRQV